jgi:hypothetical protein
LLEIRHAILRQPESYRVLRAKMAPIIHEQIEKYPDDTNTGRFLKCALARCPELSIDDFVMAHVLAHRQMINPDRQLDLLLKDYDGQPAYKGIIDDIAKDMHQDSGGRAVSRRGFLKNAAQIAGLSLGMKIANRGFQHVAGMSPIEPGDMPMIGLESLACYGAFRLASDTQIRDDVAQVLNNFNSKITNDIMREAKSERERFSR